MQKSDFVFGLLANLVLNDDLSTFEEFICFYVTKNNYINLYQFILFGLYILQFILVTSSSYVAVCPVLFI